MTQPQPFNVKILKTNLKFPRLKKDLICTIPEELARQLMKDGEAELADPLDVPSAIFGENTFAKDAKQKKEPEQKKTSLYIDEKYMYEQIKKPSGCCFLRYEFNTGNLTEHAVIELEEPTFPINDEEVKDGHIKLPSCAEEYGNEEQLIVELENHVKKYLDVPADYLHYAVLNIVKSWVYERYRSLNYLRVQGEPGTGKSRFLDVIGGLHYKPIATSGASTVSPIFRLMNKWGCTLIMDEADLKQSDETNDLIKIINQGFEKDRPVIRCNPDDKSQVEFFKVYCPKVLSTRHAFDDVATESRCMTQIMTGTSRSDIISSLNDAFYAEQQMLRNKLLLWRFRNYKRIMPDIGETLDWTDIEPRLKQVNVGFISLIHQDKSYVAKFMDRIRKQQQDLRNERSETYEGYIVAACSRIILENRPITAKTIIDYAELTDSKGNKWKPRRIASYMKTLGFLGTKVIRVEDTTEKEYQYKPETVAMLLKKYLPKDEYESFCSLIREKADTLKGSYHNHFIVYFVTDVTIVYEQGKNGNTHDLTASVTVGGTHTRHGNIGNMINKGIVANPTLMEKVAGEVFETEPGVYRKVL